jgi:hypothetical protein
MPRNAAAGKVGMALVRRYEQIEPTIGRPAECVAYTVGTTG